MPGGKEITIVGIAENAQLNVSPTLFVSYDTYLDAVKSVNPDAGTPLPNVLGVVPADGYTPDEAVVSINEQSLDLDALTKQDAAAQTPGVAQVQQSFNIIFLLYGLVVPCVTGLFFLIVTFQKANSLTLLRAIGAPAGRLVSSLLIQVVVIIGLGLLIGTLLYFPVSQQDLGGIALQLRDHRRGVLVGPAVVARRAELALRRAPRAADRPDRGNHRAGGRLVRLALKELRRRPGRFATATIILTLIAILLMFLGGLLDGLIASSTGAIRAQDADAIVYSDTAQASFVRSRIDPELRAQVEAVDGVVEVGGIGNVQLGARVPGNGPRDLASVALFGYELAPTGVPDAPAYGQAWADETIKASGVEEGMVIELGPARSPIEIIGFVEDTNYNGQSSLWASPDTWRDVLEREPTRRAARPRRVPGPRRAR